MKVLELFAGSRSIGKAAEAMGHEVFSVDIKEFEGIDLAIDIEFLQPSDIPFIPDMIWASPPCTTYSVAAISHHRPTNGELSDFAKKSDRLVKQVLYLIEYFGCTYYIENPRGMLRKQEFMLNIPKATVWYCQYGDTRAKPTDIWTNNLRDLANPDGWQPRPECWNGREGCHEKAPRGARTGTQGIKGNYERSKIPHELCVDVIMAVNHKLATDERYPLSSTLPSKIKDNA